MATPKTKTTSKTIKKKSTSAAGGLPGRKAPTKKLDLAAIAALSLKARLGKHHDPGDGILMGVLVRPELFELLGKTPSALAKEIAADVAGRTGARIVPRFVRGDGGILVGFLPPAILDER